MQDVTFITGNQNKADRTAQYLGFPIKHVKLDLDEIQSLDLRAIIEHKVRQAYEKTHAPVIVEDSSLEFEALGGLPGPFIRFFVDNMSLETICGLLVGHSKKATAKTTIGYYDGTILKIFEGSLGGEVAPTPAGALGWDWDRIFVPEGYAMRRAELSEEDYQKTYLQIKPLAQLKEFLESL